MRNAPQDRNFDGVGDGGGRNSLLDSPRTTLRSNEKLWTPEGVGDSGEDGGGSDGMEKAKRF
eukprot:TRINITY_DN3020_c0_g1_i1.p3 TRINITY_DN3020_c0_g1~~TRINITY_DN3020_c0_g1_i1.p3  ORF type:complete len:62 (+),score=18.10 TRINITY_DN3020_c0_g1_i1:364-549(+)